MSNRVFMPLSTELNSYRLWWNAVMAVAKATIRKRKAIKKRQTSQGKDVRSKNHKRTINFKQSSSIIFNHIQSSSIVFNRLQSSSIIFNHLQSSSVIFSHLQSSAVIFTHLHQSSSIIFNHRQLSSWIIVHHLLHSPIIVKHLQKSSIIFSHLHQSSFSHRQSSSIIFNQFQSSSISFNHLQSHSVIFNHLESLLNDHFTDWTTLESNMTRPGLDQHTTTNKNKGWDFHWENAQVHEEKPLAAQLRCCTLCSHCGVKWFKYAFIILYNYIARQQGPVACAADCWIGHKTRQPSAPLR